MKISDMLAEDHILVDLRAKDKKEVLEELAEVVASHDPSFEKGSLVKVLMEREKLGSTGIGDGVAIPHGKFPGVEQPIISFGRSRKGLNFDSMDGAPAFLFFLLVAPENSASVHLKALARIAKILKNSSFRKMLMDASTRQEIYRTIIQNDEEF